MTMETTKPGRIETPLAHAKGLGSTHEGAHHWLMERLTSVALIPLVIWFVWSFLHLRTLDYIGFTLWLADAWNAGLMLLTIAIGFWHAVMGLQVVIEDYVASYATKFLVIIVVKGAFALMAVLSFVSILKIAL